MGFPPAIDAAALAAALTAGLDAVPEMTLAQRLDVARAMITGLGKAAAMAGTAETAEIAAAAAELLIARENRRTAVAIDHEESMLLALRAAYHPSRELKTVALREAQRILRVRKVLDPESAIVVVEVRGIDPSESHTLPPPVLRLMPKIDFDDADPPPGQLVTHTPAPTRGPNAARPLASIASGPGVRRRVPGRLLAA